MSMKIFLAGLLSIGLEAASVRATTTPMNVSLPSTPPASDAMNVVYDNFLGISWELNSFNTLWGESPDTMPDAMQNYLSNIRARMSNPLRIRVGGNSMDGSTYVPDQSNMITLTDPDAYYNDVPVDFGPILFDVMNAMYDKVGSMMFTIGLSMRDPSEDGNVIELASAAEDKFGDRLDAMLLGNEPDLYANHGNRLNYTIDDYIPEIVKVINDLKASSYGDLLPRDLIGGPTVCCDWDLGQVIEAGLSQDSYKYYTIQHYPNNRCNGVNAQNTNMSYYLCHSNTNDFVDWNNEGVQLAKQANIPVLLTEYNTVSCGGTNVSDTFGATMWTIDTGLKAASLNFSGIYLHTREYEVQYNLFDPPTPETSTESGWRTGSVYYTELFLAEALSSSSSVVVDLNMNNSIYDEFSTTAAYGIYDDGGQNRSKAVLFNFADSDSPDANQTFLIPADLSSSQIGVRLLTADAVWSNTTIRWAGQWVGPDGVLDGEQETTYTECSAGCNVTVPGPGVALVVFEPDYDGGLYSGNATVAGLPTDSGDSSSGALRLRPGLMVVLTVLGGLLMLEGSGKLLNEDVERRAHTDAHVVGGS